MHGASDSKANTLTIGRCQDYRRTAQTLGVKHRQRHSLIPLVGQVGQDGHREAEVRHAIGEGKRSIGGRIIAARQRLAETRLRHRRKVHLHRARHTAETRDRDAGSGTGLAYGIGRLREADDTVVILYRQRGIDQTPQRPVHRSTRRRSQRQGRRCIRLRSRVVRRQSEGEAVGHLTGNKHHLAGRRGHPTTYRSEADIDRAVEAT